MKKTLQTTLGALALTATLALPAGAVTVPAATIAEADVLAAQDAWGAALVRISKDFEAGGIDAARKTAADVIDGAYGYAMGPVLFKPTLAQAPQTFRTTREGALAYFIGHDEAFPQDSGFALKGWRSVEIENAAVLISGDVAKTIGKVRLTDSAGAVTEVDKSWAFKRDDAGALRIVLHHSSLPFAN